LLVSSKKPFRSLLGFDGIFQPAWEWRLFAALEDFSS
jgi:hypothetical protein